MYLGIDLGTSAVKILAMDDEQAIRASVSRPVVTVNPRPGWCEQDPDSWVAAVFDGLDSLAARAPDVMAAVRGIGFSGQMHAALLLGADDRPLRPAILWNDSRAVAEAEELARADPGLAQTLGVLPMPGFTGPKLLWLSRNEPHLFDGRPRLLFPKDHVRLALTGEHATDVSDAAGSWLLDQAAGNWSESAVKACGAAAVDLPRILGSSEPAARLRSRLAQRWGLREGVEVVTGAGDAPAGCVGVGVVGNGQGLVSLGTSAQVAVVSDTYSPAVERLVHSFRHAVPGTWYNMAALLNGASALAHVARWTGYADVATMLADVEAGYDGPGSLLALPYLAGERTPHNDATARGAFIGMSATTERRDLALAMMEAVAFSLCDGLESLRGAVDVPESMVLVGGGSGSPFWTQMVATTMGIDLEICAASERGPAFGAARLAMMGMGRHAAADVLRRPSVLQRFSPDRRLQAAYAERIGLFRSLYRALAPEFRALAAIG